MEVAEAEVALLHLLVASVAEVGVKTQDLVAEEAETGQQPQNRPVVAAAVENSSLGAEVVVNRSQQLEEGEGGSPAGPRRCPRQVGAEAVEGGCPWQVEVEGNLLAVVRFSWQPREAAVGAELGLEAVGGGSRLVAGVEVEVVQERRFQSPE